MYIPKEDGFTRQYSSEKASDPGKNFHDTPERSASFVSKLFGVLLFFLVLSFGIVLVYEAGAHVATPSELMRLRDEIRYLEKENAKLRVENAELKDKMQHSWDKFLDKETD
mmetsp:Transcript_31598/g.48316  ORF Transcript_31598/g.48316 Transcript_31598/m.48316 type:complete len:111 (+) Transcript_31598:22-354(+)